MTQLPTPLTRHSNVVQRFDSSPKTGKKKNLKFFPSDWNGQKKSGSFQAWFIQVERFVQYGKFGGNTRDLYSYKTIQRSLIPWTYPGMFPDPQVLILGFYSFAARNKSCYGDVGYSSCRFPARMEQSGWFPAACNKASRSFWGSHHIISAEIMNHTWMDLGW